MLHLKRLKFSSGTDFLLIFHTDCFWTQAELKVMGFPLYTLFQNNVSKFCWGLESILKVYLCSGQRLTSFLLQSILLPQSFHETRHKNSLQKVSVLQVNRITSKTREPQEKEKLIANYLFACTSYQTILGLLA